MSAPNVNIYIVYYSMYGHVRTLAQAIKKGAEKIPGVTITLYQVAETLPQEVLEKMHAAPKSDDPIITAADLAKADGIIFGTPTRFGMACAQMKALLDATGGLWMSGGLQGKTAGVFFSTGTQAGGQETTALTFLTQLTHHGMVFVPLGYANPKQTDMSEIHGGSPYGCGTYAGPDGKRQPTEIELSMAETQGEKMASTTKALVLGRAAMK